MKTSKVKLLGANYLLSGGMTPEEFAKEVSKNPVSMAYVKGVLRKLTSELGEYNAELVSSDGDLFISIIKEDREIMISPVTKNQEVFLQVERLLFDGSLRSLGSIPVDSDSTYKGLSDQIRRIVLRAIKR
jgi:hypothetical protein